MPCRQIGIHADPTATPPTTQSLLSLDGGCHHDELNPTVLKVILVSCATVAAGMSHSQMRHFEGISSLAGVEFYFACGGLRRESRRDNNMIAALVSVMRLPKAASTLHGNACAMQLLAMPNAAACVVPHILLSPRATRDLRAMQNYETSITL